MTKTWTLLGGIAAGVVLTVLGLLTFSVLSAGSTPWTGGWGFGQTPGWYGNWGGGMMGPGMMGGGMMGGWGFGPNQPGPGGNRGFWGGGMMGPGMMGGWPQTGGTTPGQSLTIDDAKNRVDQYLANLGRQDLKLDEIMEFSNNFYALVKERDTDQGAFELLVDRYSGAVYPEMGPNMMWNTEYGMMGSSGTWGGGMMGGWGFGPTQPGPGGNRGFWGGGMMGPGMMGGGTMGGYGWNRPTTGDLTIDEQRATTIAQQYLDQTFPGAKVEKPTRFSGYYTLDFERDGKVQGMLSVNGYTGQVWYHSWHGTFVQEKEY